MNYKKHQKLITTFVLYYIFLQLALRFALLGPTMLDLKEYLNVSFDRISLVFSAMCVGICTGSLSTGLLTRLIPSRELCLGMILFITACLEASVTYSAHYWTFMVINFALGLTSGASISTCEAWILALWRENGSYMQALQFCRGVGYILGPVLASPFLTVEQDMNIENDDAHVTNTTTVIPSINLDRSRIHIPYLISSIALFGGALLMFAMFVINQWNDVIKPKLFSFKSNQQFPVHDQTSNRIQTLACVLNHSDQPSSDHISTGNTVELTYTVNSGENNAPLSGSFFDYFIMVLASVFYLFFYEEVIITYLPSYGTRIGVKLSKSEASFMTSAFNIANVVGKTIGVVLSATILGHMSMLYWHLSVTTASLVALLVFADHNRIILWVSICSLGYGLSCVIASLYTLLERSKIPMSAFMCGILNTSGTLGSVFMPLIIRPLIEHTPAVLMWTSLFCTLVCLILIALMHYLLIKNGRT